MIEAVHQKAAFFVDREVEGAAHPLHTALFEPGLGSAEQVIEHGLIVFGVQKPEMADIVLVALLVQPIDLRTDPSHRPGVPKRQPILALRMLEIGVLLGVQGFVAFDVERRRVALPTSIEPIGQIDERLQAGPIRHRSDVEGAVGRMSDHGFPRLSRMGRSDLGIRLVRPAGREI